MIKKIFESSTKASFNKQTSSSLKSTWRPVFVLYSVFGFNLLSRSGQAGAAAGRAAQAGRAGALLHGYCCLVATAMVCSIIYYTYRDPWLKTCFFLVFEYVFGVLITNLNVSAGKIEELFPMEKSVDAKLNFGPKEYAKIKRMHDWFVAFIFIRRPLSSFLAFITMHRADNYSMYFVMSFVVIAGELIQVPRFIFFLTHYYKMKMLRKNIKRSLDSHHSPVEDKSLSKCSQTLSGFEGCYRDILDDMESTSAQIKPMLMVSLCCCFPKIMCVVYIVLWSYKVSAVPIWYIFMITPEVMMWAFLPCLVGVFVEIIKYEIDNIKCILSNELIETTNSCHRAQLEQFLHYMSLRPFSYSVWRLLRVDGALPAALLALLTTHLIVLIQFTELYE